jgi:hypothetical protein
MNSCEKNQLPLCQIKLIGSVIPILNKMFRHIHDTWPHYCDPNVMPRQSRLGWSINWAYFVDMYLVQIRNSVITVLNSFPYLLSLIRKLMLIIIHSSVTNVESTYESHFMVDDDHFLMVWPKKRNEHVIGMS